jgi:hypothetical protein
VWTDKYTNVSEVLTASIFVALMMEAVGTSEKSINFTSLRGATTQKTAIYLHMSFREIMHLAGGPCDNALLTLKA